MKSTHVILALGAVVSPLLLAGCKEDPAESDPSEEETSSGGTNTASGGTDDGSGGVGNAAGADGSGGGSLGGVSGLGGDGSGGDGSGGDGGMGGMPGPVDVPGGCFYGGSDTSAAVATGKCSDPIIIDMRGKSSGEAAFHTVVPSQHGDETYSWWGGGCSAVDFSGAANDYVFQVLVDGGVDQIDVSVDGQGTADPRVAIIEDSSCGQPVNACSDDGGPGECEHVSGTKNSGVWFGTGPFVLVSEATDSGEDLTVRFMVDRADP